MWWLLCKCHCVAHILVCSVHLLSSNSRRRRELVCECQCLLQLSYRCVSAADVWLLMGTVEGGVEGVTGTGEGFSYTHCKEVCTGMGTVC